MKTVNKAEVRTIHPEVVNEIGMDVAIEMLGVARDLRSGVIKPENFNMAYTKNDCNTICCIAGWVDVRMQKDYLELFCNRLPDGLHEWRKSKDGENGLTRLFCTFDNNPQRAANVIERYVYDFAINPWYDG